MISLSTFLYSVVPSILSATLTAATFMFSGPGYAMGYGVLTSIFLVVFIPFLPFIVLAIPQETGDD